ncbi:hypothetical protein M0805_009495 [Coniferiporia weirii]|nr:hypothetical protein M0805_009495 [Coniferiporia weirii]
MFATFLTATLISALSIRGALAEFSISTVTLTQCAPAHITWNQAVSPYNLAVVPADAPCDSVLVDLGDHDGLSMTWPNVTLPAGTQVVFSLLDSDASDAWSATMTVADGDDSCLPASSVVSSAASSVSSAASSDASVPASPATTLVLTSSLSDPSEVSTAAPGEESATIVGAANAGTLPISGAMSSVRLPAGVTMIASLVAVAAAMAL